MTADRGAELQQRSEQSLAVLAGRIDEDIEMLGCPGLGVNRGRIAPDDQVSDGGR